MTLDSPLVQRDEIDEGWRVRKKKEKEEDTGDPEIASSFFGHLGHRLTLE